MILVRWIEIEVVLDQWFSTFLGPSPGEIFFFFVFLMTSSLEILDFIVISDRFLVSLMFQVPVPGHVRRLRNTVLDDQTNQENFLTSLTLWRKTFS